MNPFRFPDPAAGDLLTPVPPGEPPADSPPTFTPVPGPSPPPAAGGSRPSGTAVAVNNDEYSGISVGSKGGTDGQYGDRGRDASRALARGERVLRQGGFREGVPERPGLRAEGAIPGTGGRH